MMTVGERIKSARDAAGMTQEELALRCGTIKQTIYKYECGIVTNIPLDKILALAHALGVSPNYLAGWEQPDESTRSNVNTLTPAETAHLARYRALNAHSRGAVDAILAYESSTDNVVPLRPRKVIPLIGASFAAGPGEPDFGNGWEDYEVDADSRAEFALRVNGDSMEPVLHDGQIALGIKRPPEPGEVGAFLLDGAFLVKQCAGDNYGNVYLFSFNPAYEQINVMASGERSLLCFGTVILDRRYPLP